MRNVYGQTRTFPLVGRDILFHNTILSRDRTDRVGLLTSLRVRFVFGAPLVFTELSSEALRLPAASEGIMGWSRLLMMVEVMFT